MTSGPRLETPGDESASPPSSASNLGPAVYPISSPIVANDISAIASWMAIARPPIMPGPSTHPHRALPAKSVASPPDSARSIVRRCGRSTAPCKPDRPRSLAHPIPRGSGRPTWWATCAGPAQRGPARNDPEPVTSPWGFKSVAQAVRSPRDAHQALRGKPWGFKSVSNLSTCSEQGEHRVVVSEDRHRTGLHAPTLPLPARALVHRRMSASAGPSVASPPGTGRGTRPATAASGWGGAGDRRGGACSRALSRGVIGRAPGSARPRRRRPSGRQPRRSTSRRR